MKTLKNWIFFSLGRYLPVFVLLMPLVKKTRDRMIKSDTEIVIEGFPRSGNTFSLVAFETAQKKDVAIAHHVHSPVQVRLAVKRKIPCVVLVRDPLDAVTSLTIRHSDISLRRSLDYYINFYSDILALHENYVTVMFDQVIEDFGQVIERVNKQFSTEFEVFEHSPKNIEICMSIIEDKDRINQNSNVIIASSVARPSHERDQIKIKLKERLCQDDKYVSRLDRADRIYEQFVGLST